MTKEIKGKNIADGFLVVSQILFFVAILLNYLTDKLFPEIVFILVAIFLLIMSIVTFIIKMVLKSR